jgi:hypothetical protein
MYPTFQEAAVEAKSLSQLVNREQIYVSRDILSGEYNLSLNYEHIEESDEIIIGYSNGVEFSNDRTTIKLKP